MKYNAHEKQQNNINAKKPATCSSNTVLMYIISITICMKTHLRSYLNKRIEPRDIDIGFSLPAARYKLYERGVCQQLWESI
jgi:hypothetical protein